MANDDDTTTTFKSTVVAKSPYGNDSQWTKGTKSGAVKFEDAIQKRTKASVVEFLGKGSRGLAFLLSNGKVLKLTDDVSEASSSATLKGKKLKNVVEICDVFQLGELPIYGIVQEKVKPLTKKFSDICDELFSFLYFNDIVKFDSVDKVLNSFKTDLDHAIQHSSEDLVKQILNGIAELASKGITFTDVTYKNIGRTSDGVVKIFDIGYSKGPKASIPTIKEVNRFAGAKLHTEEETATSKQQMGSVIKKAIAAKRPFGYSQWPEKTKDKVVKFEDAIQKRTKTSISKFLGIGTCGIAFLLSNSNVLKLTDDKTEADASAMLKGKSLKNVVKIYDVFELSDTGIYGIVQERVKPLNKKFSGLCKDVQAFWFFSERREQATKLGSVDKVLNYYNIDFGESLEEKELVKQILNGLLELAACGITFTDAICENIGKTSDGVAKIFDIGYSRSPEATIPTIKEIKQLVDLKLWVEVESIFQTTIDVQQPSGSSSQWTKGVKGEVAKFENAIQKQTKASITKFLGTGTRGIALALSNGKVLKLTDDLSEAGASAVLKGKKLKNVVEIYDVFQLGKLPIYGIVQEKVEPLGRDFGRLSGEFASFWGISSWRKKAIELGSADKVLDYFNKTLKDYNIKSYDSPDTKSFAKQLLNGLLELTANNITFFDIIYKNLGKASDGTIKIFDIGYSQSPETSIPAIKEAKQFASLKLWVERVTTNGS